MPRLAALLFLAATLGPGLAPSAEASRLALLVGGSGERESESFLIADLRDLATRLSARGWDVRAAAGPKDALVNRASVKGTNANILRALRELLARAKPGDEALVVVHSHGRAREADWGQRSHSIVSEDTDPSGAEPGFDLDPLGPILDQASSRGIGVGLVDLSCYSGATQALLRSPASCTITLAAPNYISLCSGRPEERLFSARFLALPKAGEPATLEGQFLGARRADLASVNLPQISSRSTPAVDAWDSLLQTVDPLDVYEDLKNFRAGPKPFAAGRLLDALVSVKPPLMKELRSRLDHLLGIRARLEKQVPDMTRAYDEPTLELKLPAMAMAMGRNPLKISPGNLADLLDRAEKSREPKTQDAPDPLDGYTDAQRNLISALTAARGSPALSALAKPLAAFRAQKSRFDNETDALATAAGKLMDLERDLYEAGATPVADSARAGACQAFTL